MSLVGIRDMSVIETPPKDRLAIQTSVLRFDQQVIAKAVRSELAPRCGRYFVHNRVQSIYAIGDLLQRLVPAPGWSSATARWGGRARAGDGGLRGPQVRHPARDDDRRERPRHPEREHDPHQPGRPLRAASQLYYQGPGRATGPARLRLPALVPPGNTLTPVARRRLAAIREFSDLGSGPKVAALDLEIRGAGNLLGGEQSGQIEAIGFEMATKLLEQTVRELKGEETRTRPARRSTWAWTCGSTSATSRT